MSEYQYYEFAAIDRPLSRAEMAQLRTVSTRAEITAAGFVNHYEWGDLKADPADWMRRYFDAFVYTANWCTCRLALRVPLATFVDTELAPFMVSHVLAIEASDEHWTIDESENYARFEAEDGSGWMRRLAPLRDELLRGDLRPLYLGWLAAARERRQCRGAVSGSCANSHSRFQHGASHAKPRNVQFRKPDVGGSVKWSCES